MARADQKKKALASIGTHAQAWADTAQAGAATLGASAPHPTEKLGGTPLNKMGVTEPEPCPGVETVHVVMRDDGQVVPVLVRRAAPGSVAHVDWVNFTVGEETWTSTARRALLTDDEYISEASRNLEEILGFGVTAHMERGRNFYQDSWVLGDKWGFVCFGGQNATMLVMISGQGCLMAKQGWEKRLHEFLTTKAKRPKMTRIDLAHDDFEGAYISVDWADQQDQSRGFCCTDFGEPPTVEHKGAWRRPSGKGRTLTVGLRESGKYCRFYEKGKKEGDKSSPWTRCEVEFKSSDRFIPFDVLLRPSDYFLAAYPCFSVFDSQRNPERIETKKKTAKIVWSDSIEITKHQFGKYLRAFRDFYQDDKTVLDLVCNDATSEKESWPRRLLSATQSLETVPQAIHWMMPATVLTEDQLERSLVRM